MSFADRFKFLKGFSNYRFARYKRITAKKPNIMFGNQTAINGENADCSAMVPKTLSKNTNIKAREIPTAKFIPIPPLLLKEATATAIIVSINAETGILHLL